jgi:hypothetical protein
MWLPGTGSSRSVVINPVEWRTVDPRANECDDGMVVMKANSKRDHQLYMHLSHPKPFRSRKPRQVNNTRTNHTISKKPHSPERICLPLVYREDESTQSPKTLPHKNHQITEYSAPQCPAQHTFSHGKTHSDHANHMAQISATRHLPFFRIRTKVRPNKHRRQDIARCYVSTSYF